LTHLRVELIWVLPLFTSTSIDKLIFNELAIGEVFMIGLHSLGEVALILSRILLLLLLLLFYILNLFAVDVHHCHLLLVF